MIALSPYLPDFLPLSPSEDTWGSFGMLEYQAVASLSKLAGMMEASAKADLFWLTWLLKEAQSSNVIEGTVTTFDEVLGENAGIVVPVERQDDVREVLNYCDAMNNGIWALAQGRDFSLPLVKALHACLLEGTRGQSKSPGQWRTIQVHIGKPGALLSEATYVPPAPFNLEPLLENWIHFVKRDDINPLIQAAVMHAQFEMIHPFCDGNGRMGRLLISLFLVEKKVISKPCFYMSAYLQDHRSEYYGALNGISGKGEWRRWIEFFLNAVIERSRENMQLLEKMTSLYEMCKANFASVTGSHNAIQLLDYVFKKPLFTLPNAMKALSPSLSRQGLHNMLGKLEQAGMVERIAEGKGSAPALWRFTRLVDILENKA